MLFAGGRSASEFIALVAGRNIELLADQIAEFKPKVAVVADEPALEELRSILKTRWNYGARTGRRSRAHASPPQWLRKPDS